MKRLICAQILYLLFFACGEKDLQAPTCISAKVIKQTCAGTVTQILVSSSLGLNWTDPGTDTSYENVVLIGNFPEEYRVENDTLYFSYKIVETFSDGIFCELGGMPTALLEVTNVSRNPCPSNESK